MARILLNYYTFVYRKYQMAQVIRVIKVKVIHMLTLQK